MDPAITQQIRLALRSGDEAMALSLLENNSEQLKAITPFGTWLHVASCFGRLEVVEYLVRRGADVNARAGTFGGSALNEAASKGHLEVVNLLLESGAALDTTEPERNPLFSAIYGGHLGVVKLLISHGINKAVRYTGTRMQDMDAVAFARERGQNEIASFLAAE